MTVSIIICTRNRAASLRPTLESIGRVAVPSGWDVELVVLDNGSTDKTRQVVNDARPANVLVRYILEPLPGQCHARNRGLAETHGQVILFTDDDVRVPEKWLEAMCRPILDNEADAVAGGVRVAAHLRHRWLLEGFPSFGAAVEGPLRASPILLVGANMAFSRRVLERVPQFDTELGPGALGFGDESLFSMQLRTMGYRLIAISTADVEHHFDPSRLEPAAVLHTARKMGRSEAYIFFHWEQKRIWQWRWMATARATLALCYRRIFRHREWAYDAVPMYWTLPAVSACSFVGQYFRERRRRPRYARAVKHGEEARLGHTSESAVKH